MSKLLLFLSIFVVLSTTTSAEGKNMNLVAEANCGVTGQDAFLTEGNNFTFPTVTGIDETAFSCTYGDRIIYFFEGMDIQADYRIELIFFSGDSKRRLKVSDDINELMTVEIPVGQLVTKHIVIPRKSFAYGKMHLIFDKLKGANAIVSNIKVFSSNPKKLKAAKGPVTEANFDYDAEPVPQPIYTPYPAVVYGVKNERMSLNGKWGFNPTPSKGFPKDDSGIWEPIVVPGHWTMQGFTVKDGVYAGYKCDFNAPSDWAGQSIHLRFDAVFSDCVIFVNGQEVGRHLGTFTAFEFDITRFIKSGKNNVALKVKNDSMADTLGSLNQYANFPLGGILRKVTVFAVPKVHISDLRIDTQFDKAFVNSVLNLQFEITNDSNRTITGCEIAVSVPKAFKGQHKVIVPTLKAGEKVVVNTAIKVKAPKKWDNEHPNLYTLSCILKTNGTKSELVKKRFGFRQVGIVGNQMFVNGKAIKLAGVCRHEAHPLRGRSLSMKEWRKDAELYMEGNVNFIRTSHYPPAEEFIEACDELGLFVEIEAPICWIGHGANYYWRKNNYKSPKWYPYILQANMETIRFHRNNPSVILWSMANESYWSTNFVKVQDHVAAEDTTRPHAFHDQAYGGWNNEGSNSPVSNMHYPGPNGANRIKDWTRPIVFGEYTHLNVYNRQELVADPGVRNTWGDCVNKLWNQMYSTQACLGGSIWSGIDDLFLLPNGKAVGYGAWGPIDGWRRPKPEYFYLKKVYSPIIVKTKTVAAGNQATVQVENRHTFTNLKELTVKWKVGKKTGTVVSDIAPRTTGTLNIKTKLKDGDELSLVFYSNKGYIIDQFDIHVGKKKALPSAHAVKGSVIKVKKVGDRLVLKGKNFICNFDTKTGMIVSLTKNGKKVIRDGITLVVAPLKGGGCFPNHSADTPAWDPVCANWKASGTKVTKTADAVKVVVTGKYTEAEGTLTYTINGNGIIKVDYDFTMLSKVDPRQVGLSLNLDGRFDQVSWERTANFSGFPKEHIGRLRGTAPAFYAGKPNYKVDEKGTVHRKFIRKQPNHPWSEDCNELGSADFRGTRTGILFYQLSARNGDAVTILSDGKQAGRCRVDGDKVRLYSIDIDTGGAELFLGSHLGYLRKPLAKGAKIMGSMTLQVK